MFSKSFTCMIFLLVPLFVPRIDAARVTDLSKEINLMESEDAGPGIEKKTIKCWPWTKAEKQQKVYFYPNYELKHVNTETAKSYRYSHYQLTLKKGQVINITMPKIVQTSGEEHCPPGKGECYLWGKATGEVSKRNCFGFSTHNDYGIPAGGPGRRGKSPVNMPSDSSAANVAKALKIEGAIFLGHDNIKEKLPEKEIDHNKRYYIVAVYIQPGQEYHFHGLFANGWFWTSSKISGNVFNYYAQKEYPNLEEQCPSGSMFKKMKASKGYSDTLGGFYLFPCNEKIERC